MTRARLLAVAALAALLTATWLGPVRAAGPSRLTFAVPVTQPDEAGQPVVLDTDVYLPASPPPAGGYPLVEVFHGGGSDKSNPYDSGHARAFAQHGDVAILYSARGHGSSGGQTAVIGPKEIRDLFDVTAWALGLRTGPSHPPFRIDSSRIVLTGYSQGGLHTNLGQVWATDPGENPYGISFRGLLPGNTPDLVFNALVQNGAVKLTFGVGLIETYEAGTKAHVAPIVYKWIATATADEPDLYGPATCATSPHDTMTSTLRADLAWRSVGCRPGRMALPWLWAQGFDDALFPPDMAINLWRSAPGRGDHYLYLDMGGHAAPAAPAAVEADKLARQIAFTDHVFGGTPWDEPPVVYWTRDPRVVVPATSYAYPGGAWYEQSAATWPPPGTRIVTGQLGADGRVVPSGGVPGVVPLGPVAEDEAHDTVALAAASAGPAGTSPVPAAVPPSSVPGSIARFVAPTPSSPVELDGSPVAHLAWIPATSDSQLVIEIFDVAGDGTLTLLSRGVTGLRGAAAGVGRTVTVTASDMSALIRPGHHLETWVMAGDQGVYKPYPDSLGGTLLVGAASTIELPLRALP